MVDEYHEEHMGALCHMNKVASILHTEVMTCHEAKRAISSRHSDHPYSLEVRILTSSFRLFKNERETLNFLFTS